MTLTALDWIVICSYFAVTVGIGLYFSKRAQRSMADYFVSGRSLPWWIAGTSMVATTFAADTPLAVTGLVAVNGLAGNWVWWAFAVGGMFTVFVFAKLWRRTEVMTDVELTEIRYSGKPAAVLRGVRAIYVALVINPIIIGWVTGAMLTIIKSTLLSEPGQVQADQQSVWTDWMIIGGCLAVVALYCSVSGLWGVAIADVMQFVAAMVGCTLLAYVAVEHVGGLSVLYQRVSQEHGEQVFYFMPSFGDADAWMPLHVFLIFLLVQWWATWYPGAEPGGGGFVVQRMAACKDEKHAVAATLWYQIAHYCLRPWPWLLVAFVALAIYPETRQYAVDGDSATNPDAAFAWVMRDLSPAGLRGLMLVTFFAAFMSTISTQMNWGASYLVRDVYQRFWAPDADENQLLRASRSISLLVLVVGAVVAYFMQGIDIGSVWKALLALGAGTGAVYILRWFWWRVNAWSEITAMLASLVYYGAVSRWMPDLRSEESIVVIAGATIVTWLLITWLTPATAEETLVAFYRKARPGGPGWKPIQRLAPDAQPDRDLGWSVLAAVLGAAFVFCVLPTVGWVLFGQWAMALIGLVAALLSLAALWLVLWKIGWRQVI